MANGKSETCRDAETGTLKSETETEKFSDLIEKHICDRQTQNVRFRDPLLGCARFRDLRRICRDFLFFRGPFTTPVFVTNFIFYTVGIPQRLDTQCWNSSGSDSTEITM